MTTVKKAKFELDFTNGSVFKKMLIFALPLMATNLLQLLFNAADMIVVSLDSDTAMGSIGATTSMVNLILQLFIGLSIGTGVIMARCYGAKDADYAKKVLHTSMVLGVISGAAVGIIGIIFSKPILHLMGTPDDNLVLAAEYLVIYFLGSPFNAVYNFGAATMRALGDTKRPLIYLTIAGVLNVIINLVTVLGFHMGVVGVALATIASQAVSAALVVRALMKSRDFVTLRVRDCKIDKRALGEILRIGVPSGIQGAMFSLSNVIIQSTVNSFGTLFVNGNSAAVSLEGFVYTVINAATNTTVTAVGQNYGAKDFKRIKKSVWYGFLLVTMVSVIFGGALFAFFDGLVGLYVADTVSAKVAFGRTLVMISTYYLCGYMEVFSGALRGMGYSFVPMLMVIVGSCLFRIIWIEWIYQPVADLTVQWLLPIIEFKGVDGEQFLRYTAIFIIYPLSWLATIAMTFTMQIICLRKKQRDYESQKELDAYLHHENSTADIAC